MVEVIVSMLLSIVVIVLSAVLWRRRQRQPRPEQPSTSKASGEESVRRCPASGAVASDEVKSDPLMEFADGDRKASPVMCPFMAAFKSAKERNEREMNGDEESDSEDPALVQFKEMMDGYQTFKENKEKEKAEAKKLMEEEQGEQQQGGRKKEEDADVDNCQTMVSHIKRLEQEKMLLQLSEEELEAEEDARKSQLAEIFEMMSSQKDKFGIGSVSEVQRQMRLYVR